MWRNLRIEIVDMDGTRIDKILISTRAGTNRPASDLAGPSDGMRDGLQ